MRTYVLFGILMLALFGGGALALLSDSSADAQLDGTETRSVRLDEGWNLAGWTGPAMPFADAIADIRAVTQAAAAFDAGPRVFRTWNAAAPAIINTLDTLRQGEALWVLVTVPIDWVQPVVADPGAVALRSGFNLVTWTGQSGTPPAAGFAGLGTDLDAAFGYEKAREAFASFGPSRPTFINDLAPLRYGTGVWLLMDAPATWTQPASTAPAQVTSLDTSATLEIPRGALPAGVAASDVSIESAPLEPVDAAADRPLLMTYVLEPDGIQLLQPAPITLQIPLELAARGVRVLHVTATSLEGLADAEAERIVDLRLDRDDESNSVTATFEVSHFSTIILTSGLFDLETSAPSQVTVGSTFDLHVIVTNNGAAVDQFDWSWGRTSVVSEVVDNQWTLTGTGVGRGTIVPAEVPNVPPRTALTGESFTLDVPFTCVQPGRGEVSYRPTIEYTERVDVSVAGPAAILAALFISVIDEMRSNFFGDPQTVTCVAPPASMAFNSDGGRFSEEILIGTGMQVVLSDPTATLSDRLPITLEVDVNIVRQQTVVIAGDPADVCSNDNTCSTHMDAIDAEPGEKVEITARDATGTVVAYESLTVPHVVPGRMTFANRGDPRFPRPVSHILIRTLMEVVVIDPSAPLWDRVPITLEVRVLGVLQQTVVIDVCDPFCSTLMDAIDVPQGGLVEVTASDAEGTIVAYQTRIVRPPAGG